MIIILTYQSAILALPKCGHAKFLKHKSIKEGICQYPFKIIYGNSQMIFKASLLSCSVVEDHHYYFEKSNHRKGTLNATREMGSDQTSNKIFVRNNSNSNTKYPKSNSLRRLEGRKEKGLMFIEYHFVPNSVLCNLHVITGMFVSFPESQNTYVEALTPNVMISGDGVFGR